MSIRCSSAPPARCARRKRRRPSNSTGWATPDEIAGRVDLTRTMNALHLNMVSTLDVAYLTRDIAATSPTLTAPARQIAMRAQGEAEIAADQGHTAYEGITWATEREIAANQVIPRPAPARRGLIKATDHVIASCNSAVGCRRAPRSRRIWPTAGTRSGAGHQAPA